jgi:hypothetical protein
MISPCAGDPKAEYLNTGLSEFGKNQTVGEFVGSREENASNKDQLRS